METASELRPIESGRRRKKEGGRSEKTGAAAANDDVIGEVSDFRDKSP